MTRKPFIAQDTEAPKPKDPREPKPPQGDGARRDLQGKGARERHSEKVKYRDESHQR